MKIVESLCEVAAHTVFAVLESILWEEAHVLQSHAILALEQETEVGLLHSLGRLERKLILLPFVAANVKLGGSKLLMLLHSALVD